MTQVGTILQSTRQDLGYTTLEVSKKLKIPTKYLEAIEQCQVHSYPREPYCSLLVKDYADFLGLNGQEITKIFRRDYAESRQKHEFVIKDTGLNPKVTFTITVLIIVIASFLYLVNEYLKFSRPPQLEVSLSRDADTKTVEVKGRTNNDATVRVNTDLVIVEADGSFFKKITLKDNDKKITIESKSPSGKTTVQEKSVY